MISSHEIRIAFPFSRRSFDRPATSDLAGRHFSFCEVLLDHERETCTHSIIITMLYERARAHKQLKINGISCARTIPTSKNRISATLGEISGWMWENNKYKKSNENGKQIDSKSVDVDDNDDGDWFCKGQMTRLEQDFKEAFVQDDVLSVGRFVFALARKHHRQWHTLTREQTRRKNKILENLLHLVSFTSNCTSLLSAVNFNSVAQIVRT